MHYLTTKHHESQVSVGEKVMLLSPFVSLSPGDIGTVIEIYKDGIMINWDKKDFNDGFGTREFHYLAFGTKKMPDPQVVRIARNMSVEDIEDLHKNTCHQQVIPSPPHNMAEFHGSFPEVLNHLKSAQSLRRFYRKGWNGRDQYISIQRPDENSANTEPYLYLSSPEGRIPWVPSQADILANDWAFYNGAESN